MKTLKIMVGVNKFSRYSYACKIFVCIFFLLQTSCIHTAVNENNYVVSYEDSIKWAQYKRSGKLLPPKVIVGTYNLIIDSVNRCYFYCFQPATSTAIVDDNFDGGNKLLANLRPNDLSIIPAGCEIKFVVDNIIKIKDFNTYKNIVISSFKDTVNSNLIPFFQKMERDSANHINIVVRRAQKQERLLISYKLKGKYYDNVLK